MHSFVVLQNNYLKQYVDYVYQQVLLVGGFLVVRDMFIPVSVRLSPSFYTAVASYNGLKVCLLCRSCDSVCRFGIIDRKFV